MQHNVILRFVESFFRYICGEARKRESYNRLQAKQRRRKQVDRETKGGAEMVSANPKDLVKEFKTSRAGDVMTLLVKPEFVPAWTSNDDQPYRVYDKSFSRLVVTILWKSPNGGKMSVTGNIKIDKLAGIYRKAVNASQIDAVMSSVAFKWFAGSLQNMMDMLQNPKCTEDAGRGSVDDRIVRSEKMAAAQAVAIANGKLKGKTPLSALQEGQIDALRQQRNWLSDNLPKYPGNRKQIEAIDAALYLHDHNLLSMQEPGNGSAGSIPMGAMQQNEDFVLLEASPKGQGRKADPETGLSPCHEISIIWHTGNRYPVEVKIVNYDAPVEKFAGGGQNVRRAEKKNETSLSFRLDEATFFNDVRLIKSHMERFEALYACNQFQDADACEDANRKKAGFSARACG